MSSVAERCEAVFRLVDREIWIVTASDSQRRGGLTATWVSQASIDADRPLVLIGLAPNHFTATLVDASSAFALHLLRPDQTAVAWNFAAGSGRERDKLADLTSRPGQTGSPLIEPCLAWIECRVCARLATGDRNYYWADVVAGDVSAQAEVGPGRPLTERQFFSQLKDHQREQLKANRDQDILVQRPLMEAWRDEVPGLLRWP